MSAKKKKKKNVKNGQRKRLQHPDNKELRDFILLQVLLLHIMLAGLFHFLIALSRRSGRDS